MSTTIYTLSGKILINGSNNKWLKKKEPSLLYYSVILDYTNTSTTDNLATAYDVSPEPIYSTSGAISNWTNPSGKVYEIRFDPSATTITFKVGTVGTSTVTPPTVRLYKATSGGNVLLAEEESWTGGRTFTFDLTSYS